MRDDPNALPTVAQTLTGALAAAGVTRDMGCAGWRVETPADLAPAFEAAFAHKGPAVVDVATDPSGYPAQLKALRG